MPQFIANLPSATKWLRSGEAIGAGAKVYGYRVDNLHNETYRILNGMVRGGAQQEELAVVQSDDEHNKAGPNEDNGDAVKKVRKLKFKESDGAKTLEKPENINLSSFDS